MAYFPLFVEMADRRCLIIGGGKVAFRKAEAMAEYGARVRVIAPEVCRELQKFGEEKGEIFLRKAEPSDAEWAEVVICASDDHQLHEEVFAFCRERNIPVNTADDKALCTFYFPALARQKDVVVGISTGGQSPAAARYLREQIQKQIPAYFGELAETLGRFRPLVMEQIGTQKEREAFFRELLQKGLQQEGHLTWQMVQEELTNWDERRDKER